MNPDFRLELLPLRPHLRSDESLSSWLFRLANSNHCSISQLLMRLGHRSTTIVQKRRRDLEFGVSEAFMKDLAEATGQDFAIISRSTFRENQAYQKQHSLPYAQPSRSWALETIRPILVSVGPFPAMLKVVTGGGMQYCPACLRSEDPYIPLMWRYSFVTVCPKHRSLLSSICPHCGAAVTFSVHGDLGHLFPKSHAFRHCRVCAHDLTVEHLIPSSTLATSHLNYLCQQQALHLAILTRGKETGRLEIQQYLLALEWILSLFLHSDRDDKKESHMLRSFLHKAADVIPFELPHLIPQGLHVFKFYGALDRGTLLILVSLLLDPWPDNFIAFRKISEYFDWRVTSANPKLPVYISKPDDHRHFGFSAAEAGSSLGHYVYNSAKYMIDDASWTFDKELYWSKSGSIPTSYDG